MADIASNDPSLRIYLQEIQVYPLLTRSEEYAIGKKAIKGNKKAQEQLVNHNLRLVVKIANQYKRDGIDYLDLINEGNIGLVKASKRFDPDNKTNAKFSTYSIFWIKQMIRRYLGNHSRTIRLPIPQNEKLYKIKKAINTIRQEGIPYPTPEDISKETGMSVNRIRKILAGDIQVVGLSTHVSHDENSSELQDTIPDESIILPINQSSFNEEKQLLSGFISQLNDREQLIIKRRFGIDRDPHTLDRIGKDLKVTRERVRQVENIAMAKLRHLFSQHNKGLNTTNRKGSLGGIHVQKGVISRKLEKQEDAKSHKNRQKRAAKIKFLNGETLTKGEITLLNGSLKTLVKMI